MHTHTHTQRGRAIEITAILIDALAHRFTSILLTLRESALARATVIDTLYALTTRAHARTHALFHLIFPLHKRVARLAKRPLRGGRVVGGR